MGYLPLSNLAFIFKFRENTLEGGIFFLFFFSEDSVCSGSPRWAVIVGRRNGKGGEEVSFAFLSLDDKRSPQKGMMVHTGVAGVFCLRFGVLTSDGS